MRMRVYVCRRVSHDGESLAGDHFGLEPIQRHSNGVSTEPFGRSNILIGVYSENTVKQPIKMFDLPKSSVE